MTTFGDGVFQYGGTPVGAPGMLPLMGGPGKAFFVDPANGTASATGLRPDDALTTISAAYALCTDKAGDTIYLLNDGNTSGSARETAKLTWAKDNTHLVGLCAPAVNQRSRITPTSASTDVDAYTPFLTVSGHGNIFQNIALVQGNSEDGKASVGILNSGNRNYFNNVSVLIPQHANQGDEISYSVQITGSESIWDNCYIGSDTIARGGAASANVRFGAGAANEAARNIFRNCIFPMWADDVDPVFITAITAFDTQRWNLFDGCNFINTGTSSLTEAVTWTDTTGKCFLKDCAFYGMDDITAADSSYIFMYGITGASVVDVGHYKGVDIA